MKPRVLITTAAGRTGSVAALELVRRGHPVRGLVRRDDHRAQTLRTTAHRSMLNTCMAQRQSHQKPEMPAAG